MRVMLRAFGMAGLVLLVPAVVVAQMSPDEAYRRLQERQASRAPASTGPATQPDSSQLAQTVNSDSSASADRQRIDLRSFGVKFDVPAEYLRVPELRFSQLARFGLIRNGRACGLVEFDQVTAQPPADVARKLAADRNGHVSPVAAKWGGCAVTVVELPPQQDFTACRAYILGDKRLVVVASAGVAEAADLKHLEATLADSFAFTDPVPAHLDLSLRKRAISLFESGYLISLPEPFRLVSDDNSPNEKYLRRWLLGAHDWTTGQDEATVQAHLLRNPQGRDLGAVAADLGQRLAAQFALDKPVSFKSVGTNPVVWVSETFAAKRSTRIVMFACGEGRIAQLLVTSTAARPEIRQAYMDAVDVVARSIRYSEDYEKARNGG